MSQPNSSECLGENPDFPATGPSGLLEENEQLDSDLTRIISA